MHAADDTLPASEAFEAFDAFAAHLADPATHGGERPRRIDTHTAAIFLAGERACKLRRPVDYGWLDHSTRDRRRAAARRDAEQNDRTAPGLCLGVAGILRERGRRRLTGPGALPPSGTGKSKVARALAARLGAAVLRSDGIRKGLRGVPETERLVAATVEGWRWRGKRFAASATVSSAAHERPPGRFSLAGAARSDRRAQPQSSPDAIVLRRRKRLLFSCAVYNLTVCVEHKLQPCRVDAVGARAIDCRTCSRAGSAALANGRPVF